jgi:predicted NAD/FAD-binding protein
MDSTSLRRDVERDIMSSQKPLNAKDGRKKKILVVGAGAAGMSCAHHLSQAPDKYDITLIDAVDYCGGQAFSIPLNKERHGASWFNQGVQGGSYIFHHTLTMFAQQGYHADPVNLQVSFGKDNTFWTNVFPTDLIARHQKEVKRLAFAIKFMRWFEILFALIPMKIFFKLWMFSEEFTNVVALPMVALFLGTGNYAPEVPTMMLERLCTSPTYGMWYPYDSRSIASNMPPMVVFPNFSEFYETWRKDLVARGVNVRLSTELVAVLKRDRSGVIVSMKKRTPTPDHHNPNDGDPDAPTFEEHYDELVLCCLADTAKRVLSRTSSWRERKVLGSAKFSDDITITHTDSDYMKKHYQNFYDDSLAVRSLSGSDQTARCDAARQNFRPMYYIKMYEKDLSKLEMCFDTTNYQCQFPQNVPFEDHVFQTIYLNKGRDGHLWTDNEIDESKIIRKDWWHQLCHSYTHYLFVVPWMMFLQGKRRVRYASSWTMVNAHEVAIMSGIAAAVDLGAEYPEDLENDQFAFLSFRLYYLLVYGKWYRRKYSKKGRTESQKAKEGASWASGLYGSVYKGPGVVEGERTTWNEEMKMGRSTGNLADESTKTRSQP